MTDHDPNIKRVCTVKAQDGSTYCENTTNTQFFDGYGWRCRWHIPEGQSWPHSRRGVADEDKRDFVPPNGEHPSPPPNGGEMATMDDARLLIVWAGKEMALGRITESRARGVVNVAKSFIQALGASEANEELEAGMEALRKLGKIK